MTLSDFKNLQFLPIEIQARQRDLAELPEDDSLAVHELRRIYRHRITEDTDKMLHLASVLKAAPDDIREMLELKYAAGATWASVGIQAGTTSSAAKQSCMRYLKSVI